MSEFRKRIEDAGRKYEEAQRPKREAEEREQAEADRRRLAGLELLNAVYERIEEETGAKLVQTRTTDPKLRYAIRTYRLDHDLEVRLDLHSNGSVVVTLSAPKRRDVIGRDRLFDAPPGTSPDPYPIFEEIASFVETTLK